MGSLAFITPDLSTGPAGLGFWLFFGGHLVIVGFAIYDLVARAYRPNWRDFFRAVTLGLAYIALIVPINLLLDANYAYVGRRLPHRPTPIDYFPRWPWRIFVMIALGIAGMALLTLPWRLYLAQRSARDG